MGQQTQGNPQLFGSLHHQAECPAAGFGMRYVLGETQMQELCSLYCCWDVLHPQSQYQASL